MARSPRRVGEDDLPGQSDPRLRDDYQIGDVGRHRYGDFREFRPPVHRAETGRQSSADEQPILSCAGGPVWNRPVPSV